MTKEELEARILEINKGLEQTAANYNMLMGARMEVQSNLDKLNKQEKKEPESVA